MSRQNRNKNETPAAGECVCTRMCVHVSGKLLSDSVLPFRDAGRLGPRPGWGSVDKKGKGEGSPRSGANKV